VFSRTSSAVSQRSESRHAIGIDPNQFAISFRYKRATEIYGENEPAEYLYQITEGAVRSCQTAGDTSVRFIWRVISSASRTGLSTASPLRRSSTLMCG
jgi:hypothetical protein